MNLPNRYPEDELDHLVHGALKTRVSGKEPPERVWKQIKAELHTEGSPPPRRFPLSWPPLVTQTALTLLLVILGGIGLQTVSNPGYVRHLSGDVSPPQTIENVGEQPASPGGVPMFDDEAELRSLRSTSKARPEAQSYAGPHDRPSIIASPGVPPNMPRTEEPAFESESSSPLIVEVQHPQRGGPYPW